MPPSRIGTLLLLAIASVACSDTPVSLEEVPKTGMTLASSSSMTGYTSWGADNILEVTDNTGADWKYVRSGPTGAWTDVEIYKDGALQAIAHPTWSSGEIVAWRFEDTDSNWIDADETGTIVDSSEGSVECEGNPGGDDEGSETGGGGGDGGGEDDGPSCDDTSFASYTMNGSSQAMDGGQEYDGPCDEEFDDMQDSVWTAVGGGALTLAVGATGAEPIAIALLVGTALETVEAVVHLVDWVVCEVSQD